MHELYDGSESCVGWQLEFDLLAADPVRFFDQDNFEFVGDRVISAELRMFFHFIIQQNNMRRKIKSDTCGI